MKKIEDEKKKLFIQKSYIFELYIIGKLILWRFQKCLCSMENIHQVLLIRVKLERRLKF